MSVPGFAVWAYVSHNPGVRDHGISTISLFGMAFLAQMVRIGQPVIMAYRTSTLYGSLEQVIGGAAVVAALSIASIIGPQVISPDLLPNRQRIANYSVKMYPKKDAPQYLNGFTATCCLLAVCIISYASIPLWLQLEAKQRKKKTGHALPLQAMIDAENSQVSPEALARIQAMNDLEEARVIREKIASLEEGEAGNAKGQGKNLSDRN